MTIFKDFIEQKNQESNKNQQYEYQTSSFFELKKNAIAIATKAAWVRNILASIIYDVQV